MTHASSTTFDLTVRTGGRPFFLELGQSQSAGWKAETSAGSIGARQVVDGYANGWLVRPPGAGTVTIKLRWTPQRGVWAAFALSAIAILVCVGIVAATARPARRGEVRLADAPSLVSPFWYPTGPAPSWAATAAFAGLMVVAAGAFSRPWVGLVAGAATLLVKVREARVLVTLMIPALLALGRFTDMPELAWLAVALLAVDLGCGWLRARALRR